MMTRTNVHSTHLRYEVMGSESNPDLTNEIVTPDYAPVWIHIIGFIIDEKISLKEERWQRIQML